MAKTCLKIQFATNYTPARASAINCGRRYALGVPIAGDGIYPVLTPECATPHEQPPLQLLAQRLAFIDPLTGQWRAFCSQRQLGAAAAVL
jgi:uncharacterized iron-regulated membrane protein